MDAELVNVKEGKKIASFHVSFLGGYQRPYSNLQSKYIPNDNYANEDLTYESAHSMRRRKGNSPTLAPAAVSISIVHTSPHLRRLPHPSPLFFPPSPLFPLLLLPCLRPLFPVLAAVLL